MLLFDGASHTYSIDGRRLPSVTQALKDAGILDFSKIPADVLAKAAARGRTVHTILQRIDEGHPVDLSVLDTEIAGHVEAAQRFYLDARVIVGMVEVRRYHLDRWYAGTLDRTLLLQERDQTILDFKTGMVLDGHRHQLAGYTHLLPNPRRFRRIALQTFASKKYRVHEYPVSTFERDSADFFRAVERSNQQIERSAA